MPDAPPAQQDDAPTLGWTAPQRRFLLGLLTVLLVLLSLRYACNPVYVPDPQPEHPPRAHELADRLDPNTADWQTLAALPSIGERRARDIVAYREQWQKDRRPGPPFTQPSDLLRIRGIGYAMMSALEPYLIFQSPRPTTQAQSP